MPISQLEGKKRNLYEEEKPKKNNEDNIFITEDLTIHHQRTKHKKDQKTKLLLDI